MMVKALFIPVSGPARIEEVERNDLRSMQDLVGGYLEAVWLPGAGRAHLYVNEEGKLNGLPMNVVANTLWHRLTGPSGDVLVGDALVLGGTAAGNEADCPQWVVDLVL
jgi:hypothetical protein